MCLKTIPLEDPRTIPLNHRKYPIASEEKASETEARKQTLRVIYFMIAFAGITAVVIVLIYWANQSIQDAAPSSSPGVDNLLGKMQIYGYFETSRKMVIWSNKNTTC